MNVLGEKAFNMFDDDLMSICPHCGFLLGAFVPGMPCPSCGEILL